MNKITKRIIPHRLLPDENDQFIIHKPYGPIFHPDKPLLVDAINPDPNDLVIPKPDEWFFYDSWNIELACKLITLGYNVDLQRMAEQVKDWPPDCEGRDRFSAMATVYCRAFNIAESSIKAGTIKENDSPRNWIKWAQDKGYSVAHLKADSTFATDTKIPKGIDKQTVILKFQGIYWSTEKWSKYLANPPQWLEECRVSKGTKSKKNPSTWNPVQIAIALIDRGESIKKLDAVFVGFKDWHDEWVEKSEYLR